jgi:flagellar hook-associated protein 3 FlgL
MRVSNKMISDRVLFNLTAATRRFLDLQTASSSGKRINKPSDDPLGIVDDLSYRSRLSDISQYYRNITHSKSWLAMSDQALNQVNELIITTKDLAVQLGNDTYDDDARLAGATQVREIFDQILDAAFSQYQGKYIFSGSKTDLPPFATNIHGVAYQGDYKDNFVELGKNSMLKINSFGPEFLTSRVYLLGDDFDLNPGVQANMWLSDLNGGAGVNMGGGQFMVDTLNGTYTIDLSVGNVKNIQKLLDTINAAGVPNLTALISDAGSGLWLEDTTPHHLVAVDAINSTPLSMLNGGMGVSTQAGTDLVFRTNTPAPLIVNIDISAATNIYEVMDIINTELPLGGINDVTVALDPEKNNLVITDASLIPRDLIIEDFGNGTAAADLGIKGTVQATFAGTDLNPLHIQVRESAPSETLAKDLGLLVSTKGNVLIGEDINPVLTNYTRLASLNSNGGIEFGKIRISSGLDYVDIDLSTFQDDQTATINDLLSLINHSSIGASAYINSSRTGIVVESQYDDRTFTITEADDGRTAKALGIFGSSDLLGNMMILEKAFERNNTTEIELTLDIFDEALEQLLTTRASIGSRIIRADTAETDTLSQEVLVTNQLSQVEDADMLKVITDLTIAETLYQTALASAARVIQPSLLDFLS